MKEQLEQYPKVKKAFDWYAWNNLTTQEHKLFYGLDFSMQFGVWVDFCDSVGVDISIRSYFDDFLIKIDVINYEKRKVDSFDEKEKTRPEARQKAFEQSLTILNEKL